MTPVAFPQALRRFRPGPRAQLGIALGGALAIAAVAIGPARLIAQIEGDRGIAPLATTSDIEVDGIEVNTTGANGREARDAGWKEARQIAWQKHGGPSLDDAQLDAMTAAIVVHREQIGPRRYIATLSVIFDRAKAGEFSAAVTGEARYIRSAPLLVIPVLFSGGVQQVFEVRSPWQRAWANFQTGASQIDYVRPSGSGGESLLITAGQVGRHSRLWWRNVLDQFGAADVLIPEARLERQWPGGPVTGTFTARFGPDNTYLDSFTLTAPDDHGISAMLNEALVRIDLIYRGALADGRLTPDPTLNSQQRMLDAVLAQVRARMPQQIAAGTGELAPQAAAPGVPTPGASGAPAPAGSSATAVTIQFPSPDGAAVDAALGAVRGVPGVSGVATSSLAMGGASVLRASFAGTADALAAELRTRGWQVSVSGNALVIRR
jgi:hypothetical protein